MTTLLFAIAMASAQTITVDAASYETVDGVTVTWTDMASLGAGSQSFVALAESGSPDSGYEPQITVGSFDGSATLYDPPVGVVEVRFYDSAASGVVLARTDSFTVAHPAGELPSIAVSAPPVAGDDASFDYLNADGYLADWVAIAYPGSATTDYLRWQYTDGAYDGTESWSSMIYASGPAELVAGDYEVRLFHNNGYVLTASSTFTVTDDAPPVAGTLGATQMVYTPSEHIELDYTDAPGGAGDELSLSYPEFGPLDAAGTLQTVAATGATGSATFAPVNALGPIVGRYIEAASSTQWNDDIDIDIDFLPRGSVTSSPAMTAPADLASGQRIDATWSGSNGSTTDFVAIARAHSAIATPSAVEAWAYTGTTAGTISFYNNLAAGDYVVRYYESDAWTLASESDVFTVSDGPDAAEIVIPRPHISAGERLPFSVRNVELDAGSYIGMWAAGSSEHAGAYASSSLPATTIDSASGAIPASVLSAGSWELRLYNGSGQLYATESFTVGNVDCHFYEDLDGDGFMGADLGVMACDLQEAGWLMQATEADCDDLDASLNPADLDADGFSSCDADCDDDTAAAHPMGIEMCGDGVDNDCMGGDEICVGLTDDSCLSILTNDPGAADGVYSIDPDGVGPMSAVDVYCDMTTDGGGWMLMAKFSQHEGVASIPSADYDDWYRQSPIWIEGGAEALPTDPAPQYDRHRAESQDWAALLETDGTYELRQRAFKGDEIERRDEMDVSYVFTYPGTGAVADDIAPDSARAWLLSDRNVITDDTGVAWDTPAETVRFWLPFTENITGASYTGCGSYRFDTSMCSRASGRRDGNAGIIGSSADSRDPALSWAPHTSAHSANYDLAYVHQAPSVYGTTGDELVVLYYIR